jgi:hypothetical protein
MCQSQAKGGLRCAGSTKPRFDNILKEILNDPSPKSFQITELQLAASAYASTPSGSSMVKTVADTLWAEEPVKVDIAMALEIAAQVGRKNREIAKDVARITKNKRIEEGLTEDEEGNVACFPAETPQTIADDIVRVPKFNAEEWLALHNYEKGMSDLWKVLVYETNDEGRHEARKMLQTVKEEDIATYLITKNESERVAIIQEISDKLDLDSREVAKLVHNAMRRHLRTRMGKDKVDLVEKMQVKAIENGVQVAWVFQKATMSETDTWAMILAKKASRRSRYESVATAFIRAKTGLTAFQMTNPKINVEAIRFTKNGGVKVSNGKEEGHSKSVDIAVIQEDGQKVKVILASHKFANDRGGAQDNQWADAKAYLNNSLAAQRKGADIPELRAAASEILGRGIAEADFSWEPALILDGTYFQNAPAMIKADRSHPLLSQSAAFVGDVDAFVARFVK